MAAPLRVLRVGGKLAARWVRRVVRRLSELPVQHRVQHHRHPVLLVSQPPLVLPARRQHQRLQVRHVRDGPALVGYCKRLGLALRRLRRRVRRHARQAQVWKPAPCTPPVESE